MTYEQAIITAASVIGDQLKGLQASRRIKGMSVAEGSLYTAVSALVAVQDMADPSRKEDVLEAVASGSRSGTDAMLSDTGLTIIANFILAVMHLCGAYKRIVVIRVWNDMSTVDITTTPDGQRTESVMYVWTGLHPKDDLSAFPKTVLKWLEYAESKLPPANAEDQEK